MTSRATEVVWPEATAILRDDPGFGPVVEKVGPVRLPVARGAFPSLLRAIVYQQLAGSAAAAIHGRVREAMGGDVRPAVLLGLPDDVLRAAGLSRRKLRAARDLAEKVHTGELDPGSFPERSDAEVVDALTRVWGIGPWTARMHLLFELHRPDVWPVGDLGVRRGWARIRGLAEPPESRELESLADPFRPWRSAVAWYCWRAADLPPPTVDGAGESR